MRQTRRSLPKKLTDLPPQVKSVLAPFDQRATACYGVYCGAAEEGSPHRTKHLSTARHIAYSLHPAEWLPVRFWL
ncbi:hypothetical protein RHIZ404_200151 [Rhizobium sp. EC-SD404]|nr:hypothetical protein RHIZ404_200151 [Rhizobium sp. EC-SD404]